MNLNRRRPVSAIVLAWSASLALGLAVSGARADSAPVVRPATAADCGSLAHQFDVAWRSHSESPHAASARRNRDLGEASCAAGRYAEGVHQLRRALHDIGVKPVKVVPARRN